MITIYGCSTSAHLSVVPCRLRQTGRISLRSRRPQVRILSGAPCSCCSERFPRYAQKSRAIRVPCRCQRRGSVSVETGSEPAWPLVGRDNEVRQALAALGDAAEFQDVALVGDSGVGKSRLARAIGPRVARPNGPIVLGTQTGSTKAVTYESIAGGLNQQVCIELDRCQINWRTTICLKCRYLGQLECRGRVASARSLRRFGIQCKR